MLDPDGPIYELFLASSFKRRSFVIEEELQHRGEMNAIFWQMNLSPPVTEWMEWVSTVAEERTHA